MPASIVGDDAEAFLEEEQHLVVPVIGAERPAMMKMNRLRVFGAPILVKDLNAVLRRNGTHGVVSFIS